LKHRQLLILCPDHPQAATVKANIDAVAVAAASAGAKAQADASQSQAVKDGKYANEGKHLERVC
jgi:hypothetical protein